MQHLGTGVLAVGLLATLPACAANTRQPSCYRGSLRPAPRISVRPEVGTRGLAVLVLDGSSNAPVPGAQVIISPGGGSRTTDSLGISQLSTLSGHVHLLVRALGYKRTTDSLSIPIEGGRFLIVQLQPDPVCLEEIISFLSDPSSSITANSVTQRHVDHAATP